MRFVPKRVYFEPQALEYNLGRKIRDRLEKMGVPIFMTSSHNRVTGLSRKTTQESYREAKHTLVVGVRRSKDFAGCKPSANYQLPLATSCPGMCEYCYLATTLGKKPYLRVYVNIDEILARACQYITEKAPEITIFEGSATSDPIPTEYLTGLLKTTIEFFGGQTSGRFRFVTKFTDIDSLLTARHNGHTRFRFSLNADCIIKNYEHNTPVIRERVMAAAKASQAGYPLGFIIAPIFYFDNWRCEYQRLFAELDRQLPAEARKDLTFELITHRFTKRAKNNILELFSKTTLPMDEKERKFKYGQFGYGKYIYQREVMEEIKNFLEGQLKAAFPAAKIEYFV